MSTFNVQKAGGPSSPEVEGAAFAAHTLIALYDRYNDGELDATELFIEWIVTMKQDASVTITYGDSAHLVTIVNGKVVATINGKQIRLRLKADDDDFKRKKVLMITPATKPAINQPYLQSAVNKIKSEGDLLKAQAFLLGTILLKRCR
jgi:hypothetical protein